MPDLEWFPLSDDTLLVAVTAALPARAAAAPPEIFRNFLREYRCMAVPTVSGYRLETYSIDNTIPALKEPNDCRSNDK